MTHTVPLPRAVAPATLHGDRDTNQGTLLSVLCVSGDPIFREQICRNLERDGDMFVEISESAEDALNLMHYLLFEAVVTDSLALRGEDDGFLRAVRDRGIAIPFVCIFRTLGTRIPRTAIRSRQNRFLLWNGRAASPVFHRLVEIIREMTANLSDHDVRGVPGMPDRSAGPVV